MIFNIRFESLWIIRIRENELASFHCSLLNFFYSFCFCNASLTLLCKSHLLYTCEFFGSKSISRGAIE